MQIRYIGSPAEKKAPIGFDSTVMDVIQVVNPGENYRMGSRTLRNQTKKKLYLCKLDCSIPIPVSEQNASILPPNYLCKLTNLRVEVLEYINNYNGPKAVTLKTGEKAIDNDDAWIIIGREEKLPLLRHKKEQRNLEAGGKPGEVFEDKQLDLGMDVTSLFILADKLSWDLTTS